jgi:hypothetical protein
MKPHLAVQLICKGNIQKTSHILYKYVNQENCRSKVVPIRQCI